MPRRVVSRRRPSEPPLFEFCVPGPALSARTRSKRMGAWRASIVNAAKLAAADNVIFLDPVEVQIVEFGEHRSKDRDNTAKPILDAIQGILFENDMQVALLKSEWCDIDAPYKVRFMSSVAAAAFSAGDEFVWIRVFAHRPRDTMTE